MGRLSNIEWLLSGGAELRPITVGSHMAIDDGFWHAKIERLEPAPGLRVFLTTADVRRELTVQPRDNETDPWVSADVAISGCVRISMPEGQEARVGSDNAVLFRPSSGDPRYDVPGGQRLRLAGYALTATRIERLFDGRVPVVLQPLLRRDFNASRIVAMRSDRHLRRVAEALFAPNLNGPLRTLFMEGTVLQLLALQVAGGRLEERRQSRARLSAQERRAVLEARERLLADMRHPPSLGDLAMAVGLTEKRLNAGFRVLFGATAYELLRNERLDQARLALKQGEASMKQIAFRVGYNHVTNFINAFAARYGAPPGRYLRDGQSPVQAELVAASGGAVPHIGGSAAYNGLLDRGT